MSLPESAQLNKLALPNTEGKNDYKKLAICDSSTNCFLKQW